MTPHPIRVVDLPTLGTEPNVSAIRTRAPGGHRALGDGAGGSEGDGTPPASSEEAAGGFNPAAAGAEEAGLPLCDCCESPSPAAELITYHVLKCVPGEEAVQLQYFCPICFVLVVRGCTEYCELLARQLPEGEIFGDTRFVPLLVVDGSLVASTSAELSEELAARYQAALFFGVRACTGNPGPRRGASADPSAAV